MNNNERAMAVYWLDGGVYKAQSVASNFQMTENDLETELAVFKATPLYQKQYAEWVEKQKAPQLESTPFPKWGINHVVRKLNNNRIECILRENHSDRFYHVYIPCKEYLDFICDNTPWINRDDFNYELYDQQIGNWSGLTAEQQLSFLLERFYSDSFLPFRRRIGKDEFTRLTGQPYPAQTSWDKSPDKRLLPAENAIELDNGRRIGVNADLSPQQMAARNEEMHKLSVLLGKRRFTTTTWEDREEEFELDDGDYNSAIERIMENDSARLEMLRDGKPVRVEKSFLYKIDPFYRRYGLVEAMAQEQYERIPELAGKAYEEIVRSSERRGKRPVCQPHPPVRDYIPSEALSMALEEICDTPVDQLPEALATLSSVLHSMPDTKEIQRSKEYFQQMYALKMTDPVRFQTGKIFDEYLHPDNSRVDFGIQAHHNNLRIPTVQEGKREEHPQDGGKDPQDIMAERAALLERIRKEGHLPEVIGLLAVTERDIIAMPADRRPAGYPEKDRELYALYFSGKLLTDAAVKKSVLDSLTPDEVDNLFQMINN